MDPKAECVGPRLGDPAHHHAGVAVPDEHEVLEPLRIDEADDIRHVRAEADARGQQVRPVADTGEGRTEDAVALAAQLCRHPGPAPSAMPGPVKQNERRHRTGPFSNRASAAAVFEAGT